MKTIKAVALVSSGLDSMLAAKIVYDMGIEVTGLHCVFRFDPTIETDIQTKLDQLYHPVGIPVLVKDVTPDFLQIVLNPAHGYGSQVNPCIDCKIFMYRQAARVMKETGAAFLVTGEVLGQRPMTQNKPMLYHIEKLAEMKGNVLRPLSACKLRETIPEREGWVSRERLFGMAGRGRKEQIALAAEFGFDHYPQPAGGCILTNPQFSRRAFALLQHKSKTDIGISDMQLLRLGRHFWPKPYLHVIVGRSEQDNQFLESSAEHRTHIEPVDISGPVTLAEGVKNQEDLYLACAITARYCRHQNLPVRMRVRQNSGMSEIEVKGLSEADVAAWRV